MPNLDLSTILLIAGLFVAIVTAIIGYFQLRKKEQPSKSITQTNTEGANQSRQSGNYSVNMQASDNASIQFNSTNADKENSDDRAVYKKLIELLPWDGSIQFARKHDFGGGFWYSENLTDLFKFKNECQNPAFYFVDPDLEKARVDLCRKIERFLNAIGQDTFPVEGSANPEDFYSKIPPEWEQQPERFKKAVRRLNTLGDQVARCYDALIRIHKDRLN